MESHLNTYSGDIRKSVKDIHMTSDNIQSAAVHHIYTGGSAQKPAPAMARVASPGSDESELDSPEYMSDISSGAPEIVVWSGDMEVAPELDSEDDDLSSPEAANA